MATRRLLIAGTTALLLVTLTAPGVPAAGRNGGKAPTNLRVTGVSSYSVSLAWNATSDQSGVVSYTICCTPSASMTVPGSQTSAVFASGVEPGRSYSFYVYAKFGSGKTSGASNSVTATTPRDTTPPSKPALTVTGAGPNHISLAWSASDASPNLWYSIYVDGSGPIQTLKNTTSIDLGAFAPSSAHTFRVQARDFSNNTSLSDQVSASTTAVNSADTTPPSAPPNFHYTFNGPDGETWLDWDASADGQSSSSFIVYRLYINGVLDNTLFGYTNDIVYGDPQSNNVYSITATDENGNTSAPSTITVPNF
jgi:fibronectin type III domain protein